MLSEILFRTFRIVTVLSLAASAAAGTTVLRGHLDAPDESGQLRLVTLEGASVELVSDEGLDLTMRDPRLAGRTWELRGAKGEDGRFIVERLFTVKDGELHRVTYYCEICHITTHEPGLCMCCQGDTELREIPGE